MSREYIPDLIAKLQMGTISRRDFMIRASAAGLSIGLIGNALRAAGAAAQGSLPPAATIGMPNITHTTDTSKGTIKLYSSWPLTGSMQGTGGDAVEAVKMCLDDFGNAAGGFALDLRSARRRRRRQQRRLRRRPGVGKRQQGASTTRTRVVYMATYNSGAAKISIPILNQARDGA